MIDGSVIPSSDIRCSFYGRGISLLSGSTIDDTEGTRKSESLFSSSINLKYNRTSNGGIYRLENPYQELLQPIEVHPLASCVWAIEEKIHPSFLDLEAVLSYRPATNIPPLTIFRNEYATQHTIPPREFLCLTNQGLIVFKKKRPVDFLRGLLYQCAGSDSTPIKEFFYEHGIAESCAMCLVLACGTSLRRIFISGEETLEAQSEPAQVVTWATDAFFRYSENLRYPMHLPYGIPQQRFRLDESQSFGKHDGIALYFSRIVRPIWAENIFQEVLEQLTPNGPKTNTIHCVFSASQLREYRLRVVNLIKFIEKNKHSLGIMDDVSIRRSPTNQSTSVSNLSLIHI
eukprot:TRINITY_DN1879_c0_g1_i1.p1 TRINITY_DN1879_c0_g1~~TRINITY_DN1879_c0_g1_i1.p1  ORF type:complete len:366 (-),score=37.00 TRINITY_DN1879_c0_g1_i1:2-1033(-)